MGSDSTQVAVFRRGSTDVVTIGNDGAITAEGDITGNSDARLKTNVVSLVDGLDRIRSARPVLFQRIGKDGEVRDGLRIGFVAQELREAVPEVVSENEDGYLSVAYGNLSAVLVSALQEIDGRLSELENRGE